MNVRARRACLISVFLWGLPRAPCGPPPVQDAGPVGCPRSLRGVPQAPQALLAQEEVDQAADLQKLAAYVHALEETGTKSLFFLSLGQKQASAFFIKTGYRDFAGALSFAGLFIPGQHQALKAYDPQAQLIGQEQPWALLTALWEDHDAQLETVRGDLGTHPWEKARAQRDLRHIYDMMAASFFTVQLRQGGLQSVLEDPFLKNVLVETARQWWRTLDALNQKMHSMKIPIADVVAAAQEMIVKLEWWKRAHQRALVSTAVPPCTEPQDPAGHAVAPPPVHGSYIGQQA